jgi:nucleoside-diphosphate-sugar epimerase
VKVLVTGATGFLGSHVVDALERRSHSVVRFSRSAGGDVRDDASVRQAAMGCEVAFHCAGRVSRSRADGEEMYRVHVEGTRTVLDACAAVGVRRAIVASTSGTVAVSDDPNHFATEDDPAPMAIIGRWPYYRAKLFAEQSALSRSREGFDVVCVNPSLLLGPGDLHGSSTGDVRLLLEGRLPATPTGGLSFVDVRDAAEAMCLAMERGRAGERYLVGACNLTMDAFVGRLARVSGTKPPRFVAPRSRLLVGVGTSLLNRLAPYIGVAAVEPETLEMASRFWYLSAAKAEEVLGFRPRDPNVTLFDTVTDLRVRGVVWPRLEEPRPFLVE